ncbi:MAG TPA: phosphate ABC transporter substrate-binding protein [Ruminococcaceae bacterium]|nr:phosphate ABC transporter substrate-binding protein [Oscillospiraceae bacterium]
MKKLLSVVLLLAMFICLMSGCINRPESEASADSSETSPASTEDIVIDELPTLDGSTANIPMAVAMLQKIKGISKEEAEEQIEFNTTSYAYYNLVNGSADLILAYEADEDTKANIKTEDLEFHEIGLDALVFITNKNNPVDGLSTADIQSIYSGSAKNWNRFGGQDSEIIAYQRQEQSGSQALMRKLVMQRTEMAEAPVNRIPDTMMGLIEELASYRDDQNALGYSVYYYANEMYANKNLKFLVVDGVMPENETIRNKTYPHTNPFYAVIRKSEPDDSPARKMLNWILSAEGKETIEQAGYVAIR